MLIAIAAFPAAGSGKDGGEVHSSRFFISGDGRINLAGRGGSFAGAYRRSDGSYDTAAMRKINALYGSRLGVPGAEITPRFLEFLDFLQDSLSPGKRITIHSGYRSPKYNTGLRDKGRLAAKASLHQYAMAADIKLEGVSSERVWNFVKDLDYGGAGFYHGSMVHIDVGPARSWDETTSGVGTDISDDNKLIDLMTDRDIYLPGEEMRLQFTRMTAFPIGVSPAFALERVEGGKTGKPLSLESSLSSARAECPKLSSIEAMADARVSLPRDLKPGRYRVRASFCEKEWEAMPDSVESREIEVRASPSAR